MTVTMGHLGRFEGGVDASATYIVALRVNY